MNKEMIKEVYLDLENKGLLGNDEDGYIDLSKCCDLVVEEIKNNYNEDYDWNKVYEVLEDIEEEIINSYIEE